MHESKLWLEREPLHKLLQENQTGIKMLFGGDPSAEGQGKPNRPLKTQLAHGRYAGPLLRVCFAL